MHRSTTGATGAFTLSASLAANTTSYTDSTLASQTEYCYKVRSYRITGSKISYAAFTGVSCSTTFAPPPPSSPTALDADPWDGLTCCRAIALSWTDNSSDETSFRIEHAAAPAGPWTFLNSTSANATTSAIYNVAEDQQLCYRVLAVRDNVESAPSNSDCTYSPKVPTNLSAAGASPTAMAVTWSDNSGFEDGHLIERAEGGETAPWTSFVALVTLPANTSAYRDETVQGDTPYWYRVWVLREGARTAVSNQARGVIPTAAPTAPIDASAVPSSSSAVNVSVTPTSTNQEGYRFEHSADGVSGWVLVGAHANSGMYHSGLQAEATACYRVIAFNSLGESPPSNVDCTIPPAAPSDVAVALDVDGYQQITWRDNSNVEDGFEVHFTISICDWDGCRDEWYSEVLPANTTSYVAYFESTFFGVLALKDGGTSDWGAFASTSESQRTAAMRATVASQKRRTLESRGAIAPAPRGRVFDGTRESRVRDKPMLTRTIP